MKLNTLKQIFKNIFPTPEVDLIMIAIVIMTAIGFLSNLYGIGE